MPLVNGNKLEKNARVLILEECPNHNVDMIYKELKILKAIYLQVADFMFI